MENNRKIIAQDESVILELQVSFKIIDKEHENKLLKYIEEGRIRIEYWIIIKYEGLVSLSIVLH